MRIENFDNAELKTQSEQISSEIKQRLDSFIGPDMTIIYLAKEYIKKLRDENIVITEERDEAFTKSLKRKLYKKFKGCVGCGGGVLNTISRHDPILQPHHIQPREFGGKTISENAMLVCRDCHEIIHS